ncbi:hypothetical protein [Mycobacterium sp. MMS18-G62]
MQFTRKVLATSMITAASAAGVALALSATAAADPVAAPAPSPAVPGLPFLQQLASNPAAATQLMQGLTSVLGMVQPAAAAPAAAPPAASASVNLPQPAGLPAAAAAPAAAPAPQSTLPFLPVPLPQAGAFPGDLSALMPSALQAPLTKAGPATAPEAAAPAAPGGGLAPVLMPLSALP